MTKYLFLLFSLGIVNFIMFSCNNENKCKITLLKEISIYPDSKTKEPFIFFTAENNDTYNIIFYRGDYMEKHIGYFNKNCDLLTISEFGENTQMLIPANPIIGQDYQFILNNFGTQYPTNVIIKDNIKSKETVSLIIKDYYFRDKMKYDLVVFYSSQNGFIGSYLLDESGKYIISARGNIFRDYYDYSKYTFVSIH